VARVYQKDEDGTINRDNFIDVEVVNRVKMESGGAGPRGGNVRNDSTLVGNDSVLVRNDSVGPGGGKEKQIYSYEPVQEKDNVEIKNKNVTRKAADGGD